MTDPLGADDIEESSGAKQNFIGRVVGSSIDGMVEESGYDHNDDYDADVDHFAYIQVLDGTYDKNQNVFAMNTSTAPKSKWMVMVMHLTELHGDLRGENGIETVEELLEFINGRVYEWRDIQWTEDEFYPVAGQDRGVTYADIGAANSPNPMLVPIREVTDESELADLGEEVDTGDVDSVDL